MAQASGAKPKRRSRTPSQAGEALRRLVDLVSHRSGLALETMAEAGITLPQALLLNHVERRGNASPTELAADLHASLPAVSQMIDRLVQQGLLARADDPVDRRRKSLTTTGSARSILRRLRAARSADYEVGLGDVHPELLAKVTVLLDRVATELETSAITVGDGDRRLTVEGR